MMQPLRFANNSPMTVDEIAKLTFEMNSLMPFSGFVISAALHEEHCCQRNFVASDDTNVDVKAMRIDQSHKTRLDSCMI